MDYNADGKSDILIFENGKVSIFDMNASNQLQLIKIINNTRISIDRELLFGDFNGDGKSDFLIPNGTNQDNWNFFLSEGDGDFRLKSSSIGISYKKSDFDPANPYANTINEYNYLVYDFNQDGKTDIVVFRNRSQTSPVVSYQYFTFLKNIQCSSSSSTAVFEKNQSAQLYTNGFRRFAVPIYTNHSNEIKNSTLSIMSHNKIANLSTPVDNTEEMLLRQVTDSYGNRKIIHYSPMLEDVFRANLPSVYSTFTEEVYPYVDIHNAPSLKLVSKLEQFSGSNYLQKSYAYFGAVSHAHGLGFLGFKGIYHTNWHAGGLPIKSTLSRYNPQLKGALTKSFNFEGLISSFLTSDPFTYTTKTINEYESEISSRKLFRLRTIQSTTENTLTGVSETKNIDYDTYENPKEIVITTSESGSVIGTSTQLINYDNSLGGNYFIGRVKDKTNSVSSYGKTLTSSEEYLYNSDQTISQRKIAGHNTGFKTETFSYDNYGNIKDKVLEIDGDTRVVMYEYDSSGRFLEKKIDNEGLETSYEYIINKNLVKSTTDYLGRKTNFIYDTWDRIKEERDYLGNSLTTTYTKNGGEIKIALDGDDGSSSYEIYNLQGNKIQEAFKNINGQWNKTSIEYDEYDRAIKTSEPYLSSPSLWSEITYDRYGRKEEEISLTGKTIDYTYNGLTTTVEDGYQTKSTTLDALGNMISLTDEGGTVTYSYDPNGNLLETDYDGVIVTIEYDGWGRKIKLVDPSAGTYTYMYNSFDQITNETTPKGVKRYLYDDFGKLIYKDFRGELTRISSSYAYDPVTKLIDAELTSSIRSNYYYDYSYDDYGRLVSILEIHPYASFSVTNEYDDFGRVAHTRYSANDNNYTTFSNIKIKNIYKNGQHWKILDNSNTTLWELNNVDKWNTITNQSYMNGISKIVNSTSFGMPGLISYKKIEGQTIHPNILNLNYQFDEQKMVLDRRTTYYGTYTHSESFTYDNLNRLTQIDSDFGVKYQRYDNRGRISHNSLLGSYDYESTSFQAKSISLNQNGSNHYSRNSLQKISYNAFKSPVQISIPDKHLIDYEYNGNEQRSVAYYGNDESDIDDRSYQKYYSSIAPIEIIWDVENDEVTIHTYIGGDQYSSSIVHEKTSSDQRLLYLHRDYLGSILAVTDEEGDVIERRHFGAWGSLEKLVKNGNEVDLYDSSTDKTLLLDRGYTGHEHLYGVSLIHMNGRLYDPMLRRFLAPDNYIQDPYNTQNFNRYGYVLNNPLMYSDPGGEFWHIVIGAVVGGVANVLFNLENIDNFWQGLTYFGVGAAAGALGAGIGAGVSSALAGGGFSAGFMGTTAALTATTSFATGAAIGASGGLAAGFISGMGNGMLQGQSFGNSLVKGFKTGAIGSLSGGILGGLYGGIDAALDGRRFFDGATVVRETTTPGYNIPTVLQKLDGSCGAACASSIDNSFGGNLTEADVIKMFPNADFAGKGVADASFWQRFAASTGRKYYSINNSPKFFYNNLADAAGNSSRFALSTHNHAVVLQSVQKATITKISGNIIYRYSYKVMDPAQGSMRWISPSKIKNVFRIFK